jgi:diketogulonate reductase-like aldo/keto reductase
MNHDIAPIGYCPLGSPNRPARDVAEGDVVDTAMPEIVAIAEKYNISSAQVCLKWSLQKKQCPIPFASSEKNIISNYACLAIADFTDAEMDSIAKADKGSRLVKGQVFLWQGANDWQDLWDINNVITESEGYVCKVK